MSCEAYREGLIEAAASGTQPAATLTAHLQVCADCRAALAREKFLFTSIDQGLRTAANADVPPSFLPQVRAQLNDEVVHRRSWLPASRMVAAAASALVLVILLVHDPKHGSSGPTPKQNVVANNASRVERSPAPPVHPVERAPQATRSKRIRSVEIRPLAPFEQASVLVPPGQKQTIDALLSALQQGKVKSDVLLAEKPQQPLQGLQVSPLDISPIEMKPLADVSGDSRTEAEKTRL